MELISVVQNKPFKPGYPYHNDFDKIFEQDSLLESSIKDVNILNVFQKFKDKISLFDRYIYEYAIRLNAHSLNVSEILTTIVAPYDANHQNILEKQKVQNFLTIKLSENSKIIDGYSNQLKKNADLINFYNTRKNTINEQLAAIFNTYDLSDIETLQSQVTIMNNINTDQIRYLDQLELEINVKLDQLIRLRTENSSIDEYFLILKAQYENWLKTPKYYSHIIDLFKSEYESFWTDGKNAMFDERMDNIHGLENDLDVLISKKIEAQNIISFNNINISLNTYLLDYIERSMGTVDEVYFRKLYVEKRKYLFSSLLSDLTNNIKYLTDQNELLCSSKLNNANSLYVELVFEKFRNKLNQKIDIDNESKLLLAQTNYISYKSKSNSPTYFKNIMFIEKLKKNYSYIEREMDIMDYNNELKEVTFTSNEISEMRAELEVIESKLDAIMTDQKEIENTLTALNLEYFTDKDVFDVNDLQIMSMYSNAAVIEDNFEKSFYSVIGFFGEVYTEQEIEKIILNIFSNGIYTPVNKLLNELITLSLELGEIYSQELEKLIQHYKAIDVYYFEITQMLFDKIIYNRVAFKIFKNILNNFVNSKITSYYARINKFNTNQKYDINLEKDIAQTLESIIQYLDLLAATGIEISFDFSVSLYDYNIKQNFILPHDITNLKLLLSKKIDKVKADNLFFNNLSAAEDRLIEINRFWESI